MTTVESQLVVRGREVTGGSTPDWIRTNDLRFRRPLLYPAELQAPEVGTIQHGDIIDKIAIDMFARTVVFPWFCRNNQDKNDL